MRRPVSPPAPVLFEQTTGLRFRSRDLLQQALTHRSYVNEHDDGAAHNERLEFLGDAILDFVTAEMLFQRFPDMPEGDLTRLRSALVRTESLANLARLCQVGESLRMGKGEEASGGRDRINNLCGAFEALVGALYLDQGIDAVRAFVLPHVLRLLDQVMSEQLDRDARSLLQEWSQAAHNLTPQYRIVGESGPDHDKQFTVEVRIGEQLLGSGVGRSKQAAAQAAAQAALRHLDP